MSRNLKDYIVTVYQTGQPPSVHGTDNQTEHALLLEEIFKKFPALELFEEKVLLRRRYKIFGAANVQVDISHFIKKI